MIYKGIKTQIIAYLKSKDDPECQPDITEQFVVFSARPLDLKFMFAKLKGLTTARYWTGNDAWKYKHIWHYRIRAKITNWFVDKHYFIGSHLKVSDLQGIVRLYKSPLVYSSTEKRFTALYYNVQMTFKNRYGLDIIERLKQDFTEIILLPINPGVYSEQQMIFFFQNADLLIRPSRWDGEPLMVQEAIHFGLPVISTFGSQQENIRCDPDNYDDIKNKVNKVYEKWAADLFNAN